jgi:hypothetical protein
MNAIAAPRTLARRNPIGGALGLAVLSTVAASQTHAQLEGSASAASALSDGFQVAFGAGAAVSLLGGLLALVLLRPRPADAIDAADAPAPYALARRRTPRPRGRATTPAMALLAELRTCVHVRAEDAQPEAVREGAAATAD